MNINNEFRPKLSKHELILERYKNLLDNTSNDKSLNSSVMNTSIKTGTGIGVNNTQNYPITNKVYFIFTLDEYYG